MGLAASLASAKILKPGRTGGVRGSGGFGVSACHRPATRPATRPDAAECDGIPDGCSEILAGSRLGIVDGDQDVYIPQLRLDAPAMGMQATLSQTSHRPARFGGVDGESRRAWGTSGREVSGHELGARGCRRFSVAAGLCPVKKRLGDLEATVDQPTVDSDAPGGVRLAARP